MAQTDAQRRVLKDLVEFYPGFLVTGGGTGANPVRNEFAGLLADPDSTETARDYLGRFERLIHGMETEFPRRFAPARKTLVHDLEWMKQQQTRPLPQEQP